MTAPQGERAGLRGVTSPVHPAMFLASREALTPTADLAARLGVTEERVTFAAGLILGRNSAHFADGQLTPAAVGLVTRELRARGEVSAS